MNIFVIMDNDVDLRDFNFRADGLTVHLFPLTSNFLVIEKFQRELQQRVTATIKVIDSPALINDEVNLMRQSIHDWSHQLGNTSVHNKKIKDWFLFPDQGGSAWWLSLLAEKNSVQDDAFFKIAQINAIEKFHQQHAYDGCVIALTDKRQARILKKIIVPITPKIKFLRSIPYAKTGLKQKLLTFIKHSGLIGAFLNAVVYWLIWLKDSRTARKSLPSLSTRLKADNSFLFVTYFPNIDEELGKEGIFRNKYALPLQDKFAELKLPVTWLTMPVYYNNHNFASSMRLTQKFIANGEKLFVLQEFFTLKVFVKAFFWWLRQAFISFKLLYFLKKSDLVAGFTHPAALPIIRYLWWHSFVGASGTRGIIFYLTYLEVFKAMPQARTCLYFCEMQAWEKALLLARKKQNPALKTIAFQHTVIMENYFNYFYHHDEIKQLNQPADFPLPDRLLANGSLMHRLLAQSNFPNLGEAEAIRQLYITQLKIGERTPTQKHVMLVVGSYDKVETKSLLTLVFKAFPVAHYFEIWVKGSPVNPAEPLLQELGINWQAANYKICYTAVADLLPSTTIALVANTTVAIEALAFGCSLIIPLFADTMMMNPVVSTDMDYQLVSEPEQLQQCVDKIILANKIPSLHANKEFIKNYWHLDASIPRWTEILNSSLCNQTF
jgi:surface carbohydrate biosynthesis protein (TIGR04326 family)